MSASRRPGARRRSRLPGRNSPPPPDRADTTPLDVPRPKTQPLPVPGDDNPTDVVPPFPAAPPEAPPPTVTPYGAWSPGPGAYPVAPPPVAPQWQNSAPWPGGQPWDAGPTWQGSPQVPAQPWQGGPTWEGGQPWTGADQWSSGQYPPNGAAPPGGYGPPGGYPPPGGPWPPDAGQFPPPGPGHVQPQFPPGVGQVPPAFGPAPDPAAGPPPRLTVTRVAVARSRQLTAAAAERVRAASRADGAGESGLTQLLWVNALHMAGDAMIAVSLAGTLFFAATTDAQRSNVALYLLVTMAPFAVLAPIIGPALDRLQRGRRWAIAASHFGRCALALVMAAHYDDFWLYPAALGVLVLSKAHNVLRAAVVPRVLPEAMSLTSANARLSVFGLATAGVAGAIAAGIAWAVGFSWLLRVTAVVFAVVGVLAARLPRHVDVPTGEMPADIFTTGEIPVPGRRRRPVSPHVVLALRANAALRGLGGFLTIFAAFLVQAEFPGGWEATLALGAIAAAAGIGSFAGTAAGSRLHAAEPDRVVLIAAASAAGITVVAAAFFSFAMAVAVALVAAVTNALGKVSLDAIIQREVPESLRASAFARSETMLQLSWVVGGAVGIALPPTGWLGFTVAAALLVLAVGLVLWSLHRGNRPAAPPAPPTAPEPVWTADTDSPTDPLGQRWS